MTRRHGAWLLVTLITGTMGLACAQSGVATPGANQASILHVLDRYTATIDSGDVDGWMSLWAPGGVQMPPNTTMRSGLDAIRAGMEPALTQYVDDIHINAIEVTVAGDWGYVRGTYTLDSTPREDRRGEAGNGGTHVDGKFLTILQHQADGSWKIYRDIFNSNVPPN
ncbi:MAG: nuclear transport factor 2 family protein [Deinococcales bacterium]